MEACYKLFFPWKVFNKFWNSPLNDVSVTCVNPISYSLESTLNFVYAFFVELHVTGLEFIGNLENCFMELIFALHISSHPQCVIVTEPDMGSS